MNRQHSDRAECLFNQAIQASQAGAHEHMHEIHAALKQIAPGRTFDRMLRALDAFLAQQQHGEYTMKQAIALTCWPVAGILCDLPTLLPTEDRWSEGHSIPSASGEKPSSICAQAWMGHAANHLLQVVARLSIQPYEAVLGIYEEAIAIHSPSLLVYKRKAAPFRKPDRDHETYYQLLRPPRDISGYIRQCVHLCEQEQLEEALPLAERAVLLERYSTFAHLCRGGVLEGLHRYHDALRAYERALELDHTNANAWRQKGALLLLHSCLEEALDAYEQALLFAPADAHTHNGKGNVLMVLQQYRDALSAYARARALLPENAAFRRNWQNALEAVVCPSSLPRTCPDSTWDGRKNTERELP